MAFYGLTSPLGMICSFGRINPWEPVSRSSVVNASLNVSNLVSGFHNDTNIHGQHGNDIDANMDAASGLRISKTWCPKRLCTSRQRLQQQGLKLGT